MKKNETCDTSTQILEALVNVKNDDKEKKNRFFLMFE